MRTVFWLVALLLFVAGAAHANGGLAIPRDVRLKMVSQDEAKAFQSRDAVEAIPTGTELVSGVRQTAILLLWGGFVVGVLALLGLYLKAIAHEFPRAWKHFWR